MKQHQARFAAKSIGIVLKKVKGGFYLFDEKDGEQHGFCELLHEPWTADDVLHYCTQYKGFLRNGEFTTVSDCEPNEPTEI